jgi:hypothetical protein
MLAFLGSAPAGSGQPDTTSPSSETVARLLAQLSAADFRTREQASAALEKLGPPVLPALRKAVRANIELEIKRRIELVATRIENALLKSEEQRWQGLDLPRRGIKERIAKILATTPALSDLQVASAVYLITVSRPPTDEEVTQARKQFAEGHTRQLGILELTRSLVQGKEFAARVASANARVLKLQQELGADTEVARQLARLNGAELQKTIAEVSEAVAKAMKADEQVVNLAFLLVVSRFPKEREAQAVAPHLKRAQQRPAAISDLFWALINTREFAMSQ